MDAVCSNRVNDELGRKRRNRRDRYLLQLCDTRREMERRQHIKYTSLLGIIIYIGFGYVDFIAIPDVAYIIFFTRVVLGLVALSTLAFLIRYEVDPWYIEISVVFYIILFYISCLVICSISSYTGSRSYYLMFGIIYMLAATVFFNFLPRLSVFSGAIFIIIAFIATVHFGSRSPSYYYAFGSLYASCFVFGIYVNWQLNAERYNGFLNALQVEIGQNRLSEQRLELLRMSNTDALTGLQNRRSIDALLNELWHEYKQNGKDLIVFLLDIDYFKQFNDGYGHQEGDKCLCMVAQCIASVCDDLGALSGRFGGEEFIILMQEFSEIDLFETGEILRSSIEQISIVHGYRRDKMSVVTVSVGVYSTKIEDVDDIALTVLRSDQALYAAKDSGRNCVCISYSHDQ